MQWKCNLWSSTCFSVTPVTLAEPYLFFILHRGKLLWFSAVSWYLDIPHKEVMHKMPDRSPPCWVSGMLDKAGNEIDLPPSHPESWKLLLSLIPTSSGARKAVGLNLHELRCLLSFPGVTNHKNRSRQIIFKPPYLHVDRKNHFGSPEFSHSVPF